MHLLVPSLPSLDTHALHTATSCHPFVIVPNKTSQQFPLHQTKAEFNAKKEAKNVVRAKTKQKKNIKRFPMSSAKHHMQKQIMAKQNVGQYVYDRSPEHTNLPSGMQHPLQVFPGAKLPNAHPTVPHDNDLTPRQPSHGGKIMIKKNKCLGCCCCFFAGYPEGSSLTCEPRVQRR